MDSTGVPADARPEVHAVLKRLRVRYPGETPARLFDRARKEGAPIPAPRCPHRVRRGECVACEPRLGARQYFAAGSDHVHTTPSCAVLVATRPEPIETGPAEGREPCPQCVRVVAPRSVRRTAAAPARSTRTTGLASRSNIPKIGPEELSQSSAPAVGDNIDWGGFSGVVTGVTDRGVTLNVDGITLTAPWGDRATVRRRSS